MSRRRYEPMRYLTIAVSLAAAVPAGAAPISASTVEQIRRAADDFADQFAKKQNLHISEPLAYFNRMTLEQISRVATQIADQSGTMNGTIDSATDQTYRFRDSRTTVEKQAKRRKTATEFARVSLSVFLPISFGYGFLTADTGLGLGPKILGGNFVRDLGGYALWAVDEKASDWSRHAFDHVEARTRERLRAEMLDIFFTRLDEHGIRYDRDDREGWLFSQLDGHPLPNWTELPVAEKARWAAEYREFLRTVAEQLRQSDPAGATEIDRLAVQVSDAMPGKWWGKWRSATYRNLGKTVSATFKKLAELDRRLQFSMNPKVATYLSADLRPVIENADLFAAETYDYLTLTRFQLPDAIAAYLPKLRELGGLIELTHTPGLRGGGNGKFNAQIDYRLKMTFVDGAPPIEIPFALNFETTATDIRLLATSEASRSGLEFSTLLQTALVEHRFADEITTRHEARFPREHCEDALSATGALETIEAQVATH